MSKSLVCRIDSDEEDANRILLARDFYGMNNLLPVLRVVQNIDGLKTNFRKRKILCSEDEGARQLQDYLERHIRDYLSKSERIPKKNLNSVFDPFRNNEVIDMGFEFSGKELSPERILEIGFDRMEVYADTKPEPGKTSPIILYANSLFGGSTRYQCRLYETNDRKSIGIVEELRRSLSGILYTPEIIEAVDL